MMKNKDNQTKMGMRERKINSYGPEIRYKVYDLARQGMTLNDISKTLDIPRCNLKNGNKRPDSLGDALRAGREYHNRGLKEVGFRKYVYEQLSEDLQNTWDRIDACVQEGSPIRRIELLMEDKGETARQHLFLYAYTHFVFSVNKALSHLGIDSYTFKRWIERDDAFSELMDTLHWHKKNYFEDALTNLVASGHPGATIAVNQTFNKDRGYGKESKVDISVRGEIGHLHGVIDIDTLDLDIDTKRLLLKQIRIKKQRAELDTIDVPSQIEYQ